MTELSHNSVPKRSDSAILVQTAFYVVMGGVDQIIDKHRLHKRTKTTAEVSGWGTRRRIVTGSLFRLKMGLWPEGRKTAVETGDVPGSERLEVVFGVLDVEVLFFKFLDDRIPKDVQCFAWVLFTEGFLDHDPEERASHIVPLGPALFPLVVP